MRYSGAIVKTATRLMWGPDWESNTFYMDSAGMFDSFNEAPMYGDEWTHAAKIMTAEEVRFGYEYTASKS